MASGYITLTFKIDLDEGVFVSKCPELGIVSEGETIDEALANIKDAAETLLNELEEFHEVEGFLDERHIVRHSGQPPVSASAETVVVRTGEIVSVVRALLGRPVAFAP